MRRALALAILLLAGCGDGDESAGTTDTAATTAPPPVTTAPTGTVTPEPPEAAEVLVYFLRDGRIAASKRTVPATKAVARAALTALIAGPTADEREIGYDTSVPTDLRIETLTISGGTARLDVSTRGGCPGLAQIVYTLTQFPTVERVGGECVPATPVGRDAFERITPAILVESPAPFEEVASPLRLRGTANTFEANFQIELVDWDGRIIEQQFATATSGTGTRGTFDVTIPFEVDREGGAVIVFELSAADGSRINLIEIPLKLQP